MINANCRSCLIEQEYYYNDNGINHEIINSNLYCLLCKSMVDSFNHVGNDQDGQSFECSQCNNYILYFSGKNLLTKDEIYFDNEKCLIRDYEDNTSYFWYSKYKSITIDSLLFFDNKDELLNKLNKLIMFA